MINTRCNRALFFVTVAFSAPSGSDAELQAGYSSEDMVASRFGRLLMLLAYPQTVEAPHLTSKVGSYESYTALQRDCLEFSIQGVLTPVLLRDGCISRGLGVGRRGEGWMPTKG